MKEKKKHNRNRRWFVLIGLLLLFPCLCIGGIIGLRLKLDYDFGPYFATSDYLEALDPRLIITPDIGCFSNSILPKDNAEIERSGHVEFPPSATGIVARSIVGFQECRIYIKFQIPLDELQEFMDSTSVEALTVMRTYHKDEYNGWLTLSREPLVDWQLEDISGHLYGNGVIAPQASQYIVVDTKQGDILTVYVVTILG